MFDIKKESEKTQFKIDLLKELKEDPMFRKMLVNTLLCELEDSLKVTDVKEREYWVNFKSVEGLKESYEQALNDSIEREVEKIKNTTTLNPLTDLEEEIIRNGMRKLVKEITNWISRKEKVDLNLNLIEKLQLIQGQLERMSGNISSNRMFNEVGYSIEDDFDKAISKIKND
ncbi:MAG: hypothetical protein CL760_12435 [Chloroflexi bacterium]|nr:hypothetical protein [Chloroflexota bacterium]|tara:strand:+ start:5425 stop:5940 length:516 start_codon:yes stop_codon:yes gene_type:complete